MKYNGIIQKKFALLDKHLLELQSHLKDVDFDKFKNKLDDFRIFRDEIDRLDA